MKFFKKMMYKEDPIIVEESGNVPRPNFNLNLYSHDMNKNSNLLAIAESGAGKTFLFQQILTTEHAIYGSTIQSVIFTDCASEDHELPNLKVKTVDLSTIRLNPFDLYKKDDHFYIAHTLDVIKHLLITIVNQHHLSWNELMEQEVITLVLSLIEVDEQPTMKKLYELVMDRFYEIGLNLQVYFQKGKEFMQLDIQDSMDSSKPNDFLILNEQYHVMRILLYALSPFVTEKSLFSTYFNETKLPVNLMKDCDVLVLLSNFKIREILDILSSLLTVKLLEMHEAVPTPRGHHKLAVYHDGNEGRFGVSESAIYGALMNQYLRKCRPSGASLRISAQTATKPYAELYPHFATILIGSTSKFAANTIFKNLFITDTVSRQILSTLRPHQFFHYSRKDIISLVGAKTSVM